MNQQATDFSQGTLRDRIPEQVDIIYRADSRRAFATLIRLIGDFDLAEEVMHEAFAAAVTQWSRDGIPANPRACYHLAHAARADLCRRLGKINDARASYQQALVLVKQEPERWFLQKRLRELD
jgi:RNA polymerase sigma-70 factor, ECF subfamily